MGLEIHSGREGGVPLYTLAGELDIYTVPEFRSIIEAQSANTGDVAIDLREVSFVDSSGLGSLLRLAQGNGGEWRTVVLVCEGPSMPRLLELTKLADRFVLVDAPEQINEAIAAHRETVAQAAATESADAIGETPNAERPGSL